MCVGDGVVDSLNPTPAKSFSTARDTGQTSRAMEVPDREIPVLCLLESRDLYNLPVTFGHTTLYPYLCFLQGFSLLRRRLTGNLSAETN